MDDFAWGETSESDSFTFITFGIFFTIFALHWVLLLGLLLLDRDRVSKSIYNKYIRIIKI